MNTPNSLSLVKPNSSILVILKIIKLVILKIDLLPPSSNINYHILRFKAIPKYRLMSNAIFFYF